MKILSGKHKNRSLLVPKKFVRPTSGIVKEAMFNLLEYSFGGIEGRRVLDICCGSGALGLEALSRGAAHATFVDSNRKTIETVKQNIEKLGETEQCETICCDAEKMRFYEDMAYEVVFIDPPYTLNVIPKILRNIPPALAENHIIIAEQQTRCGEAVPDGFELLERRKYGDTQILFYRYQSR